MAEGLRLSVLPQQLAVCRLPVGSALPEWALAGPFFAITRTPDEVSIVCEAPRAPAGVQQEGPWRALKVEGPLDFGLVGILAGITAALAGDQISLFALSTYDTDYILVPAPRLADACRALSAAEYQVNEV